MVESASSNALKKGSLFKSLNRTVVYVLNGTTYEHCQESTLHELWTKRKAEVKHISLHAHNGLPKEETERKSQKLIAVSYNDESSNYRWFDSSTMSVRVARNVVFNNNLIVLPRKNATLVPIKENGDRGDEDEEVEESPRGDEENFDGNLMEEGDSNCGGLPNIKHRRQGE